MIKKNKNKNKRIKKSSKTLDISKNKVRNWKPDCPCRPCKTYLQYVSFI